MSKNSDYIEFFYKDLEQIEWIGDKHRKYLLELCRTEISNKGLDNDVKNNINSVRIALLEYITK